MPRKRTKSPKKAKSKLPVTGGLRVRAYDVLVDAITQGVTHGYQRAHKHTSAPREHELRDAIEQAVMDAICEKFDFTDEREGT